MLSKTQILFVLGGPGAGKGTQCKKISDTYGFIHLSIGDILRDMRNTNSEEGKLVDSYMIEYEKTGRLMPCELILSVIKIFMVEKGLNNVFILDGFIKSLEMFKKWDKDLGDMVETKRVIYYECSESTMKKRILKRGESSGRGDDNEEVFKKRLVVFNSKTMQAIENFRDLGLLTTINTESSLEEVWAETAQTINYYFGFY